MHVVIKFLNVDGYEVCPERNLYFDSMYVEDILVSVFSESGKLIKFQLLEVK